MKACSSNIRSLCLVYRQSAKNLKEIFGKDSAMSKLWLFIVFLPIIASICNADHLSTLPTSVIAGFMKSVSKNTALSIECSKELNSIESTVLNGDSKLAQHFFSAFRIGPANFLESRDSDRWMFATSECIKAAQESMFTASKNPLLFCHGYDNTKISDSLAFGMCMPAACENDKLYLLNEWCQFVNASSNDSCWINFLECTRSRLIKQWYQRTDAPVVAFTVFALLLFVAFATIYDHQNGNDTKSRFQQILLAFSAKRNMGEILRRPISTNSIISCLDGLRVLSLIWVISAHTIWYLENYTENIDDFLMYTKKLVNSWLTNAAFSVDTFFVLSATLTSFHFFRSITHKDDLSELYTLRYWLKFYRHRFLRLWPTLMFTLFIFTFGLSFANYYSSWPPTDPYINCIKYGWENILLLNSFTENRCIPWSWYISADFVLFLISPIFLLLLQKSTKYGLLLSIVTSFISSLLNSIQIIRYNFPPNDMFFSNPPLFNQDIRQHERYVYNPPQFRAGDYLVGLCLGYLLSGYRISNICPLSLRAKLGGWIAFSLFAFMTLIGIYPAIQGWDWPLYNIVYGSIHKTCWSLWVAWIIYACHCGFGGFVNRILCWPIFKPLAAVSYSTYHIHMASICGLFLKLSFPVIYTGTIQLLVFSSVSVFFAFVTGLGMAIIFEFPFMNIVRLCTNNERHSSKKVMIKETDQMNGTTQYNNVTQPLRSKISCNGNLSIEFTDGIAKSDDVKLRKRKH